ncbi:MAG: hypothetical protein A2076_00365 [Geobacteraceae bacterium GWC2_53_11]|nr:MAG: hypothetical protein A2076_00365 [Geobacteraceae bacterium GWC2_53_11]
MTIPDLENQRGPSQATHDITGQTNVENALRFSEARYRALYHDNPTMIVTLDAELNMLSVNPFCACQLGYLTEELEGQPVLMLFHEEDRSAVAGQLQICLQHPHQVHRWQFRKVRKDGVLLWVEETAQAVYDLSGALTILVVCQDVTERKQAAEEIERLNVNLAARAADLEATNRELEAFNYTVAHDLRNPLNVISSYCQAFKALCGAKLDEQCLHYVQEAYNGTLRMNRLIEALLEFSRMAYATVNWERVDLSSMAKDVAEELKGTEDARRVTFQISDGIVVNGDAVLLRVVLANLLDNAWKYTAVREEGIIEFGASESNGEQSCFVRDNGTGFDDAAAEKIFTPFQRLPGAEECRGFGIGLATVERIIKRHGGSVCAEGVPGKGATFWFTVRQ